MDSSETTRPSGPLAEFSAQPSFQLAIPARDLAALRVFYVDVLGSRVEREDPDMLELAFFGGRLVAYHVADMPPSATGRRGGKPIPVPNFGLMMSWEDWHRAVDHLNYVGITYRMTPTMLTLDGRTEAWFAIADPSGNCLAFGASRPP
ncbi:MAG: VOC family protein [Gammaproteobacteria bacterium]